MDSGLQQIQATAFGVYTGCVGQLLEKYKLPTNVLLKDAVRELCRMERFELVSRLLRFLYRCSQLTDDVKPPDDFVINVREVKYTDAHARIFLADIAIELKNSIVQGKSFMTEAEIKDPDFLEILANLKEEITEDMIMEKIKTFGEK